MDFYDGGKSSAQSDYERGVKFHRLWTRMEDDDFTTEELASLFSTPSSIDTRDDNRGMTLLMKAAEAGAVNNTKALLAAGADPNVTDANGHSALHFCATNTNYDPGDYPIFRNRTQGDVGGALIAAGADVNARSSQGCTPLHLLAITVPSASSSSLLRRLTDAGADVNARDNDGDNPLHCLLRRPDAERVTGLEGMAAHMASKSKDINAQDRNGDTALCLAIPLASRFDEENIVGGEKEEVTELVRFLVSVGADVNQGSRPPLYLAAIEQNTDVIQELLRVGADPMQRDAETGDRASAVAKANGNTALLDMLLKAEAQHSKASIQEALDMQEDDYQPIRSRKM